MSNDVFKITEQDIVNNRDSLLEFFSELKNKKFDFSFLIDGGLSQSWLEDYICDSLNNMVVQLKELKGFDYDRIDLDHSNYGFANEFAKDLLAKTKLSNKVELELNLE
jgi:hypothetical protein